MNYCGVKSKNKLKPNLFAIKKDFLQEYCIETRFL